MTDQRYIFRRGETITVSLDAVGGDPTLVSEVVALLKLTPPRGQTWDDAPTAATFAVASRAASGDVPAGWLLTIAANVSAGLEPGNYMTDAKLTVSGGVIVTEPLKIQIRPSVSA